MWDILARHGMMPALPYQLGFGRLICLCPEQGAGFCAFPQGRNPMSKNCTSQLGLFDSTNLGWGFDLGLGGSSGASRFREIPVEGERASAPA